MFEAEALSKEFKSKRQKMMIRRGKSFFIDKNAISEVLGVLIILAIILSATTIYISQQVPEWTKDFEAEHAAKVPMDFAKLASNIDMAVLSEDRAASASTPIGMKSESNPLADIYSSGGTLLFKPSASFFTVTCAPSPNGGTSGTGNWNSSAISYPDNFSIYDKSHVTVTHTGARLELAEEEEDKVFDSGTVEYFSGEYDYDKFVVTNNTELKIKGGMLKIRAKNIIIDAGSEINATGEGWPGGAAESNGTGDGAGKGGDEGSGGGGAGYGANGGDGGDNPGSGGSSYGNATSPTAMMGSGGGGGGNGWSGWEDNVILGSGGQGGDGGGYVWLEASTINISGTISANGTDGEQGAHLIVLSGGGGGGGSGGGILIKGDNVSISGKLYAIGGKGGDGGSGGGGGAGGRIKVFYDSHYSGDISNYANASGGAGGENGGADGNSSIPYITHFPFTMRYPHYSYGELTSNVTAIEGHIGYDTGSTTTRYRNMTWDATTDPGLTSVTMKVRTSMNANMSDAMDWEDCPEAKNGQDISDLSSVSDGHRYIQWRAELSTNDQYKTPVLHWVNISYEYGGELPVLVNSSGSIQFNSQYLYLPNYKLVYEHGATIKNQTGGEFMLYPPPISISKDDNGNISLEISSINLTGTAQQVSGAFSSAVKASYQDSALLKGGLNFHNITLNITTSYATAWKKWFNETCEKEALEYDDTDPDPGDYYITQAGNTVQVIFYGNESRPVNLWLKNSEAKIEIMK